LTSPAIFPAVKMGAVSGAVKFQTLAGPVKRSERSALANPKKPVRVMAGK